VGREAPIAAGRRAVTALFADVAGSTQLGAELDPEDVVEVVGGAVRHFCEIVEQYGGTVKDLAGDGILALFGAPNAHPHTEGIDRGPPRRGFGCDASRSVGSLSLREPHARGHPIRMWERDGFREAVANGRLALARLAAGDGAHQPATSGRCWTAWLAVAFMP